MDMHKQECLDSISTNSDANDNLYAIVTDSYHPVGDGGKSTTRHRLTLLNGEIVKVEKQLDDWIYGKVYDKSGWFPKSAVDILWDWEPGKTPAVTNNQDTNRNSQINNGNRSLFKVNESDPIPNDEVDKFDVVYRSRLSNSGESANEEANDDEVYDQLSDFVDKFTCVMEDASTAQLLSSQATESDENPYSELADTDINHQVDVVTSDHDDLEKLQRMHSRLVLLNQTQTALLAVDDFLEQTEFSQRMRIQMNELEDEMHQLAARMQSDDCNLSKQSVEYLIGEYNQFLTEQGDIRNRLSTFRAIEMEHKVLKEIELTEFQFNTALALIQDFVVFPNKPIIGYETAKLIFNPLERVYDFSRGFCVSMKKATEHPVSYLTQNWDSFADAYGEYFAKYNEVVASLGLLNSVERYRLNSCFKSIVQFEAIKSLEMALFMPFERVIQYPVLFGRLQKLQQSSDPYLIETKRLVEHLQMFMMSAENIRSRNAIIYKYLTPKEKTWMRRTLNNPKFNPTGKVSSQMYRKMIVKFCMKKVITDSAFDKIHEEFNEIQEKISKLIKKTDKYLNFLEKTFTLYDCICDTQQTADIFKEHQSVVKSHRPSSFNVASEIIKQSKNDVEHTIIVPLKVMLLQCRRPLRLIQKRTDKLIDYAYFKYKNTAQSKSALNEYVALNLQLIDTLPKLISVSKTLMTKCVLQFTSIQSQLFHTLQSHHLVYFAQIHQEMARIEESTPLDYIRQFSDNLDLSSVISDSDLSDHLRLEM